MLVLQDTDLAGTIAQEMSVQRWETGTPRPTVTGAHPTSPSEVRVKRIGGREEPERWAPEGPLGRELGEKGWAVVAGPSSLAPPKAGHAGKEGKCAGTLPVLR